MNTSPLQLISRLLAGAALCLPTGSVAQATATGQGLIEAAVNAPALQALRQRAIAADARIGAAGQFPDAEVEAMYTHVDHHTESFPMWEIQLRQPLPRAGERQADRNRASAALSIAEAEYAVMAGELISDAAMGLIEAKAAEQRITLLKEQIQQTETLLAAFDSQIGTGMDGIGGRLRLLSQIDRMHLMIETESSMVDDRRDQVRAVLGLSPTEPLPTLTDAPVHDLNSNSPHIPLIQLAEARAAVARANEQMARASTKPMSAVGIRFEREEESMGNVDKIGIAFMMDIPWRARQYASSEQRAARAEAAASAATATSVIYRFDALQSRIQRADRIAGLTAKTASATRERIAAQWQSAIDTMGTASTSPATIASLIELLEQDTLTQLQLIDAEMAADFAKAELWRFAPASTFR